jgi:hypothetical protein
MFPRQVQFYDAGLNNVNGGYFNTGVDGLSGLSSFNGGNQGFNTGGNFNVVNGGNANLGTIGNFNNGGFNTGFNGGHNRLVTKAAKDLGTQGIHRSWLWHHSGVWEGSVLVSSVVVLTDFLCFLVYAALLDSVDS